MFFIISKLTLFILSPAIWFIGLLILGFAQKRKKTRNTLMIAALTIAIIFSNNWIVKKVISAYETPIVSDIMLDKSYHYGIVLGGFSSYLATEKRVIFHGSADRILQTIELYKTGRIQKIVVAGGSGSLKDPKKTEANHVKEYLMDIGVPEADILFEMTSRNTYENALNVAQMIASDTSNYLLITSALHMPRALACFERQKLTVDPYPVDFIYYAQDDRFYLVSSLSPNLMNFIIWKSYFKERMGMFVYRIKGYI